MNHNILSKLTEKYIQNRIKEREDKIYAYTLGPLDKIRFVVADACVHQKIANELIKMRHTLLSHFISQNAYLDIVGKYTQNLKRLELDEVAEWLGNDKDLYDLFVEYISGAIRIAKFS